MTTRRNMLGGLVALPFTVGTVRAAATVLRAGDQKGGAQALMKAAGGLDGLPYRVDWSQFAAAAPGAQPVIARQDDCQTCFMYELYCPADALYVAPDCDGPVAVDEAAIAASGWLGQYRRHSGWGEHRHG